MLDWYLHIYIVGKNARNNVNKRSREYKRKRLRNHSGQIRLHLTLWVIVISHSIPTSAWKMDTVPTDETPAIDTRKDSISDAEDDTPIESISVAEIHGMVEQVASELMEKGILPAGSLDMSKIDVSVASPKDILKAIKKSSRIMFDTDEDFLAKSRITRAFVKACSWAALNLFGRWLIGPAVGAYKKALPGDPGALFLMKKGIEGQSRKYVRGVIAHELTHAFQDQYYTEHNKESKEWQKEMLSSKTKFQRRRELDRKHIEITLLSEGQAVNVQKVFDPSAFSFEQPSRKRKRFDLRPKSLLSRLSNTLSVTLSQGRRTQYSYYMVGDALNPRVYDTLWNCPRLRRFVLRNSVNEIMKMKRKPVQKLMKRKNDPIWGILREDLAEISRIIGKVMKRVGEGEALNYIQLEKKVFDEIQRIADNADKRDGKTPRMYDSVYDQYGDEDVTGNDPTKKSVFKPVTEPTQPIEEIVDHPPIAEKEARIDEAISESTQARVRTNETQQPDPKSTETESGKALLSKSVPMEKKEAKRGQKPTWKYSPKGDPPTRRNFSRSRVAPTRSTQVNTTGAYR